MEQYHNKLENTMIVNPGSTPKKRSYLKYGWISFVFIFIIGGAFLAIKGPGIARGMAKASLERHLLPLGVKQVEIDSINFGWGRVYMRDIHTKSSPSEPSISIQEMDIALSIFLNAKAVDIIGATLEFKEGDKINFTNEDLKTKLTQFGKAIGQLKQLKIPSLAMRDCLLIVPSTHGPVKLPLHATTETAVSKKKILTIDWGEHGEKSFSGQFVLESESKGNTIDVHMANIDIQTPAFQLRAPEISLWGTTVHDASEGYKVDGYAKLDHLALEKYGTLKQAVEINLEGEGTPESYVLDELTITSLGKDMNVLEMEGSFKPYSASGRLILTSQISQISNLWDFTSMLASHSQEKVVVGGKLNLTSEIQWDKGTMTTSVLAVDIKGGEVSHEGLFIQDANTQFVFTSLKPLNTKGDQTISAKKLSVSDIVLNNLSFHCLFDKDGVFQIRKFVAEILKGNLVAHQFQRSDKGNKPAFKFETNFKDIELAEILKLADLSNLTGSAKLAGSASVRYSLESGLDILQAELHSISNTGVIQYRPGTSTGMNEIANNKEVNMAFQVLDNLHFSVFNVRLVEDAKNPAELQGIVKILGSNPNVLNGYPFEFNIVTTGKLRNIISNTLKHMGPSPNLTELNQAIKATKEEKAIEKARELANSTNSEEIKAPDKVIAEDVRTTENAITPKVAQKAQSFKKAKSAKVIKGRKTFRASKKARRIKAKHILKQENRKINNG
jgi:hypothetical protein